MNRQIADHRSQWLPLWPLALFPGTWVAILIAMTVLGFYADYVFLVGVLAGFACYGLALLVSRYRCQLCGNMRFRSPLSLRTLPCTHCIEPRSKVASGVLSVIRHLAIGAVILAAPLFVLYIAGLASDPIGDPHELGIGGPVCDAREEVSLANGSGYVAELRHTFCDFGFAQGSDSYYLFVHRSGAENARGNLVLRYVATNRGMTEPPKISWSGPAEVSVSLRSDDVGNLTKKLSNIDGVAIRYAIVQPTPIP